MSSTPLSARPLPARRVPARRVPLRARPSGTGYGATCPARALGFHGRRASLPGRRARRATGPGAVRAREVLPVAGRRPIDRPSAHRNRFGRDGAGGAEPRPASSRSARPVGAAT